MYLVKTGVHAMKRTLFIFIILLLIFIGFRSEAGGYARTPGRVDRLLQPRNVQPRYVPYVDPNLSYWANQRYYQRNYINHRRPYQRIDRAYSYYWLNQYNQYIHYCPTVQYIVNFQWPVCRYVEYGYSRFLQCGYNQSYYVEQYSCF